MSNSNLNVDLQEDTISVLCDLSRSNVILQPLVPLKETIE